MKSMKVTSSGRFNLGCGKQVVDGWINVDYAIGAKLSRVPVLGALVRGTKLFNVKWDPGIFIHDLTKPFPWADGCASAVYTSHTLEHLYRDDGLNFIAECVRILKPGGVLRIVVPDLEPIVQRYHEGITKADYFLDELFVLYERYPSRIKTKLAPLVNFPHKCMYDTQTLVRSCSAAGISVCPRAPFDSVIEDIHAIEIESRTENAVIVEGLREPCVR